MGLEAWRPCMPWCMHPMQCGAALQRAGSFAISRGVVRHDDRSNTLDLLEENGFFFIMLCLTLFCFLHYNFEISKNRR